MKNPFPPGSENANTIGPAAVVEHARRLLPICIATEADAQDTEDIGDARVVKAASIRALKIANIFAAEASKFLADMGGERQGYKDPTGT
jgi:hypothetical protein